MKISIITVCFNSEKYIEQTILSVINQTYDDIEYIIVDGLSKDNTPNIIERYRDKISVYIRGKDKNMYDAINKGMKASTGDYIVILNSDDYLINEGVIQRFVDLIAKDNNTHDIYYGNLWKYYEISGRIKKQKKISTNYLELLCSKKLTFVGHGTVFISRKTYNVVGDYDCDKFRAAADYDYLLRAFKIMRCKYINVDLQMFRMHDESITSSGQLDKENSEVLKKNGYFELSKFKSLFFEIKGWLKFIFNNFFYNISFFLHK